jgi:hypothetical protein
VFRAIFSKEKAELFSDILQKKWINELFNCGLVRTRISEEVMLNDSFVTLEHETIPFETHPSESTCYMHWLAAKTMIKVNLFLSKHGFLLKDAHPWNIMFNKGMPIIIDFGSIIKSSAVPVQWFDEFRKYFCIPIWLASTKMGYEYAMEYRRQHTNGFGLKFFESNLLNRLVFKRLFKLKRYLSSPVEFSKHLDDWLDKHNPLANKQENWAGYRQCGELLDPLKPEYPKQKFVHEILSRDRPGKVLDFAANKGYYSEMAAKLGAVVVACDYEEYCVDRCLSLTQEKGLPITPVLLDFARPTPNYGIGLYGRNSYERFRSDIVLALGLVHHICITQNLPVEVFCDICMRYANKGIVLEYVDPTDIHVAQWGLSIPKDYSIEGITKFFSKKFPKVIKGENITNNGLCRVMMYFSDN